MIVRVTDEPTRVVVADDDVLLREGGTRLAWQPGGACALRGSRNMCCAAHNGPVSGCPANAVPPGPRSGRRPPGPTSVVTAVAEADLVIRATLWGGGRVPSTSHGGRPGSRRSASGVQPTGLRMVRHLSQLMMFNRFTPVPGLPTRRNSHLAHKLDAEKAEAKWSGTQSSSRRSKSFGQ